jgi:predicted RNA methylase
MNLPLEALSSFTIEATHEVQTPEGMRTFIDAKRKDGAPVTAIGFTPSRASEEAESLTRCKGHPCAPTSGEAHGPFWVVPRLQAVSGKADQLVTTTAPFEGTIEALLARLAPQVDKGGAVDTVRVLRRVAPSRATVDRWLTTQITAELQVGPDLGGVNPAWLRQEASGRVVSPTLRRARVEGTPQLDQAASAYFGSGEKLDVGNDVAFDLALLHVAARESASTRDKEERERAEGTIVSILSLYAKDLARMRKEPFRVFEAPRVRRRRIFSRFDEGIRFDDEGLYSATPEALALQMVEGLTGHVLDGTTGIGSLAIALALTKGVKTITAVDTNADRLAMAEHNAGIYGVQKRITFRVADVFEVLSEGKFDALVLDPPWGGRDYDRDFVPLSELGLDVRRALELHQGALRLKLPKSIHQADLQGLQVDEVRDERGVLKFVVARRG